MAIYHLLQCISVILGRVTLHLCIPTYGYVISKYFISIVSNDLKINVLFRSTMYDIKCNLRKCMEQVSVFDQEHLELVLQTTMCVVGIGVLVVNLI